MTKKLLTIDDLYNFYSQKKKSMTFNADKSGYNIAVQTKATFKLDDSNDSEGLLYGKVRAFHDLTNNNNSHIETDVLEQRKSTMKDRPIMADIVDVTDSSGNTIKDFSGHTMRYDEEKDKIIYIEHPVGHFVNPENFKLEYDEEYDRNFVIADCVIYEEYTDACDILRRRQEVDCSVELVIRSCSWDCSNKVLVLNDFYVQDCTLLGESVAPGMAGSKLSIKDFSENNNSIFYNLFEMNEVVEDNSNDDNLARFNKDAQRKEDNYMEKNANDAVVFEETEGALDNSVVTTNSTDDNAATDDLDNAQDNVLDENSVSEDGASTDTNGTDTNDNENNSLDTDGSQTDSYSKNFELSHDDIRAALYNLLVPYEEADDTYYWIMEVFDDYFIYQNYGGSVYGQRYTKSDEDETVAFEGERYVLIVEYLTESEKVELDNMRANYSTICNELSQYKESEEIADKKTVFAHEAYSAYLNTPEFEELMKEDTLKKYSKEELIEKADSTLGKIVKETKAFSYSANSSTEEKPVKMFGFARSTKESSFLDGLLEKTKKTK